MTRVLGSRLTALLFVGIVGCGGGCGSTPPPAQETPAVQETPASRGRETSPPPAPPPEDPGPAPVLRVTGTPDPHDRGVAIRVENRGTDAAELNAEVTLQRSSADGWVDAEAHLTLRYSCDDEAPECITLAPGGAYLPPPWLGTLTPGTRSSGRDPRASDAAQCECDGCPPAAGGTYRFVVRSCDRGHTVEGDPFTIAD